MTKILFFGALRDVAGEPAFSCVLPEQLRTIADVRHWLAERDPLLGDALGAPGVRMAVDQAFCVSDDDKVQGALEIAFMSPLSGG